MKLSIESIIRQAHTFTSFANAQAFANRCTYPMRIVLGDNGRFWVVPPGHAERLVNAGYAYADWD